MIDAELSAALQVHYRACFDARYDPARGSGAAPSAGERFIAVVGTERGPELLSTIEALIDEARRVPDPGGPIGNYGDALQAWAATHPEVDPREMHWITTKLMTEHR